MVISFNYVANLQNLWLFLSVWDVYSPFCDANIPHAADTSSPRDALIVATTPRLFNSSRNASITESDELCNEIPGIAW